MAARVRMVWNRIHGVPGLWNSFLILSASVSDSLFASIFASLLFKGIFPATVTPSHPKICITEAPSSQANCGSPQCRNAAKGSRTTGPKKLRKKTGFSILTFIACIIEMCAVPLMLRSAGTISTLKSYNSPAWRAVKTPPTTSTTFSKVMSVYFSNQFSDRSVA